ncbi:MAG: alpha/beta hydrolase [Planctomycetaceae bacterium]
MEEEFSSSVTLGSLVRAPRVRPRAPLVLALHGMGMTPRSFERWLAPALDANELSWWIPQGILPREEPGRRVGYAWYVFDGDQERLRRSMDEARAYLVGLTEMALRALQPARVAILGFSQGAYLGSYLALSRPDLYSGLVCCCGRPKSEFVADPAGARGVKVLIQTGDEDAAVPAALVAKGVAPLRAAGLEVTERSYAGGHRLTAEMAADAAAFLA